MKKEPRIVVSAFIKKNNRILLLKEPIEDGKDWWIIPGGGVKFGERLEDAVVREMKEELGLDVTVKKFLGFHEAVYTEYGYHTVIFFYIAEAKNDFVKAREKKVIDAGYFNKKEVEKLDLINTAKWAIKNLDVL